MRTVSNHTINTEIEAANIENDKMMIKYSNYKRNSDKIKYSNDMLIKTINLKG